MKFDRESGILLHLTSLPSKYGIGELGSEAYGFIDFLVRSRQKLWQILPLGYAGYGESPYQCFSAFAGNTLLISIDKLMEQKLLSKEDIGALPVFDSKLVEFGRVKTFKRKLYRKAFERFTAAASKPDYDRFLTENRFWLEEFSLFMALKDYFGGISWNKWEKKIAFRDPDIMEHYKDKLIRQIEYHKFLQYIFFSQWMELKAYANKRGVKIIGDMPLFISHDSSDVWSKRSYFELDGSGNPAKVAGVPPDYFSETGQLWGNPHYRWDEIEKDGFKWWKDRIDLLLSMVDIIRIDHFRGFESYWEIPAGEKTAKKGCWVKAPGRKLFRALKAYKGDLPVIAEDLGFITREVEELKNEFGFPGMKILQFTFGRGSEERFLPHNYEENTVVYTGTHDNDTTAGWYLKTRETNPEAIEKIRRYFNITREIGEKSICRVFAESACSSRANTAIIPIQDILCLGSEARMNTPGTKGGNNWRWRLEEGLLTSEIEKELARMSKIYKRNQLLQERG